MSQKIYALRCTNCAAPLNVLGGGRVRTITCEYCHSVLDMNDNYAVLSKFNDVKRPDGPFQIGMRGNIKGIEWTIIGWINYKTTEFPSEAWSEFFLYSPTYGYAWLVYEDGVVSFSMKVRDFDILQWQTKQPKTIFYHKGHYIRNESAYQCYVDYVEGELNWVAKFGDKFICWDYNGVSYQSLSIEKSNDELEVYHTERLNKADLYSAFQLEYAEKSKTNNVTENNKIKQGYLFLFLFLIAINIFSFFTPSEVYNSSMHYTDYNDSFTIHSNSFMTSIELSSQKLGASNVDFSLYQNKKHILTINKHKLVYIKKDLLNNWHSYSSKVILYLKLDKGTYTFNIKNKNLIHLNLKIEQKVIRLKYLFPLLLILFIFILTFYIDFFLKYIESVYAIGVFSIVTYVLYNMFNPTFATIFLLLFILFVWSTKNTEWDNDEDDDWDFDDD